MIDFNFKAVIDGQVFTGSDLDKIQHERHQEVLRLFHHVGADITHQGSPLEADHISALSREDARNLSLRIRQSYDQQGLRTLLKPKLEESDAMWKKASSVSGPHQVAPVDITITGIPPQELRAAMSLDNLHSINAKLNPEHFFAYTDSPLPPEEGGKQRLRIMETFGMYGGPSEVHAIVDPDLELPADVKIERDEEYYPATMRGYTTLASDGSRVGIYAFHQFRNLDDGIDARLGCILPPGTPRQVVDGHKLHMAVEFWELAKIASAAAAAAVE